MKYKKIKIIGVTGTNGKTTTTTLLFKLFRKLGYKTALISTVVNQINEKTYKTNYTTPPSVLLNKFLKKAARNGVQYVFMECSSHGIHQNRIAGINFTGGIFTNLTHDHLNYHKSMEQYAEAKKKFFDSLSPEAFALSNLDDTYGQYMLRDTRARKFFYSLKRPADFKKNIETKLIGQFNKYNVLAIYAAATLLAVQKDRVERVLKNLEAPKGRMEQVRSKTGKLGIVDYSHTPDALEKALRTIKSTYKNRKIITVVGCGGNGDKTKRPIMGKIAVDLSDYVIFTSDNPRNENPQEILKNITSKLREKNKYESIENREEAIKKALHLAGKRSIILVAGKGHEDYQILGKKKIYFSDQEIIAKN